MRMLSLIVHVHRAPLGTLVLAVALMAGGLFGAAAARAGADGRAEHDRWSILMMDGRKVGHTHVRRATAGDGLITTTEKNVMAVKRVDTELRVEMSSEFVETPEGEPVRLTMMQSLGSGPTTTIYRFRDGYVEQLTSSGGRESRKRLDEPPGEWLTPAEAAIFVEARLEAGADTIAYAILDGSSGLKPVLIKHTVVDRDATVEAAGKVVPAIEWRTTTSIMPAMDITQWVDQRGREIRSEMRFGAFKIDVLASDRETALAAFAAPELMSSTLVAPDRPIPMARRTTRGVYTLRALEGRLPDLPTTGWQVVERLGPDRVRVTVDRDALVKLPPGAEVEARYLEPSTMVDSDDRWVRALASVASAGAGPDALSRAHAMRDFVRDYVEGASLGFGFASASEVCETRQGDCSEHATLLAAMLRADDVPSRVVSGLVYVDRFAERDQVFGYHMWTQALIEQPDGRLAWIDLDAALGEDATHVAVVTSSLADGEMVNSMVAIAEMMNNLEIVVEAVE